MKFLAYRGNNEIYIGYINQIACSFYKFFISKRGRARAFIVLQKKILEV